MTWLAPWFLIAGLTVAAPILFHLWRRTPRGKRLFSSTMFLAASPPRVTHRSRIEHWLLLCLRALALILLAVAFARPVWQSELTPPAAKAPDKTVAILVDVSASLQRQGFMESLQRQLAQKIDQLPPRTQVGLFVFDNRWRADVPFESTSSSETAARRQLVREQLTKLEPGWGATKLGDALASTMQAVREFQASRVEGKPAEIWLVSDLAAGSDLAGLASIDWPETTRLELITPDIALGTNAGLQWVDQQSQSPNSPPRVRVSNAQSSARDRFQLGWNDASQIEVHVPAGQSRTFTVPERPADLPETVPLQLTGDDHDFDNRLWQTTERRRELRIVYLGGEMADDIAAPRFFLEQALAGVASADVAVQNADEAAGASPAMIVWTEASVAPPAWVRPAIEQGAALLAVPRTADDARAMAAYLGITAESIAEADVKSYSLLEEIDWEDPLLAPFAQARFADFSGIHFWKHRRMKLPESFSGRVLARFDDGDPYLIDQRLGDGRAWLMTSGWHPADSQLARSSKFAPLLERFLDLASPSRQAGARIVIGEELDLPKATSRPWIIHRPDQTHEAVANESSYARTNLPGVYVADNGSESLRFAVNVPPAESKTDPLPAETLERLGAVTTSKGDADRETLSLTARQQLQWAELERRQMFWRWCLMGAGLMIVAETLLASRRPRTTFETAESA